MIDVSAADDFLMHLLLYYFIVVNICGFCLICLDKKRAIRHQWRIRENTFLFIALLGGAIGILLGMLVFHHKTKKQKFVCGIPLILLLEFLFLCYCFAF